MTTSFVWGAGGVGKSHVAIRLAAHKGRETLLYTLDPSLRLFKLLHLADTELRGEVQLADFHFQLARADKNKLFESLESKKPASPKVRLFYEQMVKGLQDFRDYLTLIQLSDELQRVDLKDLVIDTPPFHEALGLHRSMFNLRRFFEGSLVQLALKSSHSSWLQGTLKRVFDLARIFSGKKSAEQIFDFIEWLTYHTERFSKSAKYLEDLVFSGSTIHTFILTPESPHRLLDQIENFFSQTKNHQFIINRSLEGFEIPSKNHPLIDELSALRSRERDLRRQLSKRFPKCEISGIPLMLMGEDTDEELLRFIRA